MTFLMHVCGVAASVLMLTICTAVAAAAEPASQTNSDSAPPATITLQISSASLGRTSTTVTVEVLPGAAGQPTQIRVATDSDARTPAILAAAIGGASVMSVSVDKQHPFDWNVVESAPALSGATTPTGCGPHPPANTPGCSRRQDAPVAQAVTNPTPAASTAAAGQSPASPQAPSTAGSTASAPQAPPTDGGKAPMPLTYTVQPGDTLRGVATRFYGDPNAFDRIARANTSRVMPDGLTFIDPGVIRPGWELIIPEPTRAVADRDGAHWYTVQPDDTLVGIAARLLGDGQRWPEVYALNRATQLGSSSPLAAGPSLIRPGMQLLLPGRATNTASNTTAQIGEAGGQL